MTPGREMDNEVAEKVMGWKPDDGSEFHWWDGSDEEWMYDPSGCGDDVSVFQPSLYRSFAFQVVTRMEELGFVFCIVSIGSQHDRRYEVTFQRGLAGGNTMSKQLPKSICSAALMACMCAGEGEVRR